MSQEHSPNLTDEEDDALAVSNNGDVHGILCKWTNYIHGWQDRYIILKDGTLSYYKSEQELSFGCRGAISILKANIRPHEFDECRFDVSVNDCVWYLRAETPEDKTRWVEALEHFKHESGYGSQNSLRRHGSTVSIASNTVSTTSSSSFRKGRGLKVKLAELETYRDILVQQIENLQKYFDVCATNVGASTLKSIPNGLDSPSVTSDSEDPPFYTPPPNDNLNINEVFAQKGLRTVDFRGEALTFKATTAGILTSLSHCIDVMSQREEMWKKRVEKEVEKRRKVEEYFKQALKEAQESKKMVVMGGPDCEEGPHSALNEDEFYDAVELGLDRLEEEEAFKERLKSMPVSVPRSQAQSHVLWPEIDRITAEQLHYARQGVGEGVWELFAEDGEMRMYKREEEVNGLVVDPLKAVHTVKGVTGFEMCHYFFSPDYRLDWETTIEQMKVLEKVSDDTMIFLQIHKRVWPASQRDALFWSHLRQVPDSRDPDAQNIWIVCNHSTEHHSAPEKSNGKYIREKSNGKYIRVFLTVALVCQTMIEPPKNGAQITRDDLTCKITYCSVVNPGGWAPASVLRAVYKREYPKFLKKFTHYVYDQCKNKPIRFN
ncbi:unnamed protein product [Allacma fusca]|uniref:Ceramide transfer protein n=1 Tax=Allacma fusca TaxID=39272 RepID=A0A8J2Q662_9HEXA|nr:unnamed protein product [Allacma fusca]